MREELKSELRSIDQIGENRAEEILTILEEQGIPAGSWDEFESDVVALATHLTDDGAVSDHGEPFAYRVLEQLN